MTDHTFEGVDRNIDKRARDHPRPFTGVHKVRGDGLVDCPDAAPGRLDPPDDDEPEHGTIIMAW